MYEVLDNATIKPKVLPYLPSAKPDYAQKRNEPIMLSKGSDGVKVKQNCFWKMVVRRM